MFITSSYADGLKGSPWESCIRASSNCPRNENGKTTTQSCAVGAGKSNSYVRGRRWLVDTQKAIVLGYFWFDRQPNSALPPASTSVGPGVLPPGAVAKGKVLTLHEYFKIDAGQLAGIYAPMNDDVPEEQAWASIFKS